MKKCQGFLKMKRKDKMLDMQRYVNSFIFKTYLAINLKSTSVKMSSCLRTRTKFSMVVAIFKKIIIVVVIYLNVKLQVDQRKWKIFYLRWSHCSKFVLQTNLPRIGMVYIFRTVMNSTSTWTMPNKSISVLPIT